MDLFVSLFVVAATAPATEANESTEDASCPAGAGEPSDPSSAPEAAEVPGAFLPRSLAELRRIFQGPPAGIIAFTISALTSPFLVCTVVGAALAVRFATSWREVLVWGGLAALFAGVIPFAVVMLLMQRGRVSDIHVAERERRWIPFGAAVLSGALAIVALHLLRTPRDLQALAAAYLLNAAAFGLVSRYWKISAHTGVYSGAFAACGMALNAWWWAALVAIPLVVWARTQRGRHTIAQGLAGAGMATALTVLAYRVLAGP